jgi:hypothetical protein
MTPITLDPQVPLALWVPLALAAAMLLVVYLRALRGRLLGWRRWGIPALMALAAAVPLVVLLNPTWLSRAPLPPGKPLLTVLVDASASMAVGDAADKTSRYQQASRIALAAADQLGERYEVVLRAFARDCAIVSPQTLAARSPDGSATDLAAALERSLDDERPQGQAVLLVSDGIHNVGGSSRLRETMARAKALGAPVYTKTLGGPVDVRDLEVEFRRGQEIAFVHQSVPITVTLRQRGSLAPDVNVRLLLEGKEIQRRRVKLVANGAAEEVFNISQDQPGLFRYEVAADVLAGEVSAANNTASLSVRVVDQPVRVLLLEGKPYWDTKFLIRTLSLDRSVELTAVVQLAAGRLLQRTITRASAPHDNKPGGKSPGEKPAGDGPADAWTIEKDAGKLLTDPALLARYQVVMLGRNAEVFLSDESLGRLRKWLNDEDGSLVCFRGAPSSDISQRLDELMPVRWSLSPETRFRVQWSDEGQTLGWLPHGECDPLSAMPSLSSATMTEAKPYAATVLATSVAAGGQVVPVITSRPVGAMGSGRVVVVEGAGMWRWAFLPPQHQDRDDLYGSLWRSLVRWLVTNVGLLPSQQMALRPDKATFTTEENVLATLLVRENPSRAGVPRLLLSGGTLSEPQTVVCKPWGNVPGQYHADLGALAEGRYRIRVEGAGKNETAAEAAVDVRGNLQERLELSAQPALMKWIADASGGRVLDSADPASLARHFEEHLVRSRPERILRTPVWDRWWMLVSALALWGVTWGLRRRSGLV